MAKGKKTGGREIGTPNLLTSELRTILNSLVQKELSKISKTFEKLNPEKRLDYLIKLLPYILPKVESLPVEPGAPKIVEEVTLTEEQKDRLIDNLGRKR